jgi:hypothetical protein
MTMQPQVTTLIRAAMFVGIATLAIAPPALAQQKTAAQCTQEWRANKAQNQAKGITEKAFVAQCRAGTTGAAPTQQTPAAAQQTPPPAAAQTPPSRGAATRAPAPGANRATTGAAPAGANQFSDQAQAKARCGSDPVVWVNEGTRVYHFSGSKNFGNTKSGAFMCERAAMAAGNRAAKNEKHP